MINFSGKKLWEKLSRPEFVLDMLGSRKALARANVALNDDGEHGREVAMITIHTTWCRNDGGRREGKNWRYREEECCACYSFAQEARAIRSPLSTSPAIEADTSVLVLHKVDGRQSLGEERAIDKRSELWKEDQPAGKPDGTTLFQLFEFQLYNCRVALDVSIMDILRGFDFL